MSDLEKLIAKAGAAPITGEVEFSTTGLIGLDWALGGGIARGRLIEFFGLESSGKSTIGLQAAIAEAWRTGLPALWFDYEYAWEPEYVEGLPDGSVDLFKVAQPETIEAGFELAVKALEEGWVSSLWFDSTGVMESSQSGIGTRARAMAQGMPGLLRKVASAQVVCGFISQTREEIQTGFGGGFGQGPKRRATGGAALKFAFSQRVEFAHKTQIKGRAEDVAGATVEAVIGRRVIAKVVKNKVGVPARKVEFDLIDGVGFDAVRHLIELGILVGVIKKKGAFLEVPGLPKAVQGVQTLSHVMRDVRAAGVLADLKELVTKTLEDQGHGVDIDESLTNDQEDGDDSTVDDEG